MQVSAKLTCAPCAELLLDRAWGSTATAFCRFAAKCPLLRYEKTGETGKNKKVESWKLESCDSSETVVRLRDSARRHTDRQWVCVCVLCCVHVLCMLCWCCVCVCESCSEICFGHCGILQRREADLRHGIRLDGERLQRTRRRRVRVRQWQRISLQHSCNKRQNFQLCDTRTEAHPALASERHHQVRVLVQVRQPSECKIIAEH